MNMKLRIESDDMADFPREWDNLGSFTCFPHRKYRMGDDQSLTEEDLKDLQKKAKKGEIILLPVYMYDHSGVSYSTTPFSCSWDSGLIGVIYVTREKACEAFKVSRMSKKVRECVLSALKGEIEAYDQWASGGVLQYSLEREGMETEYCGGFYSIEDIFGEIESLLKADRKQGELFSTSLPLEVVIDGNITTREISIPGLV
jgi:hypothetical protein